MLESRCYGRDVPRRDLARATGSIVIGDGGTPSDVRSRLVEAAFARFTADGFEATTVDQIADAAGVSRRTFFRYFDTKEDVVFPDHEGLRAAVRADLDRRRNQPALAAVCASIHSLDSSIHAARCHPMRLGRSQLEPSSGLIPSR